MDGTGADHHQQAVVFAMQDAVDLLAGLEDRPGSLFGDGMALVQLARGDHLLDGTDAQVVGLVLLHGDGMVSQAWENNTL